MSDVKRTASDGFVYRDLNKNGKLDIYEDPRQPISARIDDLLSQMTVAEKAGLMFSPQMDVVAATDISRKGGKTYGGTVVKQLLKRKINTFTCMGAATTEEFVNWHNAVQKAAEETRLGIPVLICSDPRHIYLKETNPLATQKDESISSWPTSLGISACRDEKLAEEYGKIVRNEFRAMGIRFALQPSADTATEPRWPRIYETFGENAEWNGKLASAYIRGMQGEHIDKDSVACCIKHFPGGGPQKDGDDPHFAYGKEQIYPGNQFEAHLEPFKDVLNNNVAGVMPYYGMPIGVDGVEEIGFNFNKTIVTDLLRKELHFDGLVHTDYSIIEGIKMFGFTVIKGRAWGIEEKNTYERLKAALDAGVDQIGGECCSSKLVKLVKKGVIPERRLDESCRRILKLKFELGLFDNPYVDVEQAKKICGSKSYIRAGEEAMKKSITLLKNEKRTLPLQPGVKIYAEGFFENDIQSYGTAVKDAKDADVALFWLEQPYYPDKREVLSFMFKSGDLNYPEEIITKIRETAQICPTIVVINMLRPAVIPEFKEFASAIMAEYDTKPRILLDCIFGKYAPQGKLPFDLPASMEAVKKQRTDVPFDYEETTYRYGDGLTYEKEL